MELPKNRALFALIVVLYLLLAVLYAVFTPDWQAPDEPAHYNYVRSIAENGSFPVLHAGDYPHAYLEEIKARRFPPDLSIEPIRYEGHQPPLYYALAAPIYSLTGGNLLALRLFSVALGAFLVVASFGIVHRAYPGNQTLALGTAAFVAFLPQHLATASQFGNDILAELLLALILFEVISWTLYTPPRADGHAPGRWRSGLLIGLILVTKATAYIAIPLVALAAIWDWWARGTRKQAIVREAAAMVLPGVLIGTPWFARNVAVYGWPDLLGLVRHNSIVVGQLGTSEYIQQIGLVSYLQGLVEVTFKSFWGVFGWLGAFMDSRIYFSLALLSGVLAVGLVWLLFRKPAGASPASRRAACLLGVMGMLTLVAFGWYNLQFVQFQGRYLFTALIPIAVAFSAGWGSALRPGHSRVLAAVVVIFAVTLLAWAALTHAEPPKWPLAITAGLAMVLAIRPVLPSRLGKLLLAAPFAALPLLAIYGLFGVIVPLLT